MRLTMRIGAAVGIVALAACSQSGQDDSAKAESTAEAATPGGTNAPEINGPSDTLGNQLNQLNDSGQNETESSNSN